ncbi:MAG: hypothetical protein ABI333_26445 [bacterium]
MKRRLVTGVVVTLALLAVVSGRVVCSSRGEYQEGHAAERRAVKATDPARRTRASQDAIVHYRRAARWYAPGNGYGTRALDGLTRLGKLAERQGDRQTALMAHRAIRRAILGARSFYTPHADRLARANRHIARLTARQQGGETAGAEQLARAEAWHLKRLQASTAPSVAWSILALLGFLGWVAGALLFIYRAITPEDRLVGRQALIWGGVILAGLLLWLLGLSQA